MNGKWKIVLVTALVLLVGLAGWFVLREDEEAMLTPSSSGDADNVPARVARRGDTDLQERGVEEESSAATGAPAPADPEAPDLGIYLVIRVIDPDSPLTPVPAGVVRGLSSDLGGKSLPLPTVRTTPAAGPEEVRLRVDVTPLLVPETAELEVVLRCPGFLTRRRRLLRKEIDETPGAETEVVIELELGHVVRGMVSDETGDPLEGATVKVHVGSGARVSGDVLTEATTDEEGLFLVRLPNVEENSFVFTAPDRVPELRPVRARAGAITELETVVLARGAEISGRVFLDERPLGGARVAARRPDVARTEETRPVGWSDTIDYRLTGESIEIVRAETETDAEGRFILRGLPTSPHVLVLESLPGVTALGPVNDIPPEIRDLLAPETPFAFAAMVVESPSSNAEFRLQSASIRVTVESGGEPVSDARLEGWRFSRRLRTGRAEFSVLVPAAGTLTATADDHLGASVDVEVGAGELEKEVTIELEKIDAADMGTLAITLTGPDGRPIDRLGLSLLRESDEDSRQVIDLTAEDGRFRKDGLLPGAHDVVIHPGGPFYSTRGFLLPVHREVEVPRGGVAELDIRAEYGGRLRIEVADGDGRLLGARCRIRDPGGRELAAEFFAMGSSDWELGSVFLRDSRPSEVFGALPPGTYSVEIDMPGFRPAEATVTVKKRERAHLKLTLEKS